MKNTALLLIVAAFALTGCTTPLTVPETPTMQYRMTYARDWEDLASRTAGRLVDSLGGQPPAVFISPGPQDMPFAVTYRKFLEKELLDRRVPVDQNGTGTTVLTFDVQTFRYKNERDKTPADYATFATTIGAGAMAAPALHSMDTMAAIVAGSGPVADLFSSFFRGTKVQVVLTLNVTSGTRVVYRDMRIFYIEPTELPFYWTRLGEFVPQAKVINAPDYPLPVRGGRP